MKISIGHAVEGDKFFGREKELKRMAEKLQDRKASIFIPGPRRIGKTSLVKEFIRRNKDKYRFIYFDLESRHSIIELCRDLTQEIKKSFPELIKSKAEISEKWNNLSKMLRKIKVAGAIEIETGEIPINVKEIMARMEDVFVELYHHEFVLAIDEFSDFLINLKKKDIGDVQLFLEWLRRLRQEEKIRLIITGSINILSTVEELNVPDLINDMIDIDILPFRDSEVRDFLTELLKDKGITFDKEVMDFVQEKMSDGIPFYIQIFADSACFYLGENVTLHDLKEVERLYQKITSKQHKEFIDLHSRLKSYLPEVEYEAVRKILAHVVFSPMTFDDLYPYVEEILPDKTKVNKVLKRLVDECYLVKEKGMYRFVSPMVQDWWKNSYDWER